MKKKIALIIAASMLFGGAVSAASMWGTYKGNNIIRLTVDQVPVKVSDVPVINYNGRTMIPIYLLQQAGIKYSWDPKNQSVDILSSSESTNGYEKYFLDIYKDYESLGQSLDANIAKLISIGMLLNTNMSNANLQDMFTKYTDSYNTCTDLYNSILKKIGALEDSNQDVSAAIQIAKYYSNTMDSMEKGYNGFYDHFKSNRQSNLDSTITELGNSLSLLSTSRSLSQARYADYFKKIK